MIDYIFLLLVGGYAQEIIDEPTPVPTVTAPVLFDPEGVSLVSYQTWKSFDDRDLSLRAHQALDFHQFTKSLKPFSKTLPNALADNTIPVPAKEFSDSESDDIELIEASSNDHSAQSGNEERSSTSAMNSYDPEVVKNVLKRIGPWAQQRERNQRSKWNFRYKEKLNRPIVDCDTIDIKVAIVVDGSLPIFNVAGDQPSESFLSDDQLSALASKLKDVAGTVEFQINRAVSQEALDASASYQRSNKEIKLSRSMLRYYTPFKGETRNRNFKRRRIISGGPDVRHSDPQTSLEASADLHTLSSVITDYSAQWVAIQTTRDENRAARKARVDPHHQAMLAALEADVTEQKQWYYKLMNQREGLEEWEAAEPKFETHKKKAMPTPEPLDFSDIDPALEYEEGVSWQHMDYKIPKMHIKGDPRPSWKDTLPPDEDDDESVVAHESQQLARPKTHCSYIVKHYEPEDAVNLYKAFPGLINPDRVKESLGSGLSSQFMRIGHEWWDQESEKESWFEKCVLKFETHCGGDHTSTCTGFIISSDEVNWNYCAVLTSGEIAKPVTWKDEWIDLSDSSFTTYVIVDYDPHPRRCDDRIFIENITTNTSRLKDSENTGRRLKGLGLISVSDPALMVREIVLDSVLWEKRTGTYAYYQNEKKNIKYMNLVLLVTDRMSHGLQKVDGKASITAAVEGVHSSIVLIHKDATSNDTSEAFAAYGDWIWSAPVPDNGGDVLALVVDPNLESTKIWTDGEILLDGLEVSIRNFIGNYYKCESTQSKIRRFKSEVHKTLISDFRWSHNLEDMPKAKPSPRVWPEDSTSEKQKPYHGNHVPPTAHEAQWYGAFAQVFNPCINVHESNTTFPIWVGGNWNLYDKESWARFGNVYSAGHPDWMHHVFVNPLWENDQAYDFYNYDASFLDLEGGVCGNAFSSGDAQLRPRLGDLALQEGGAGWFSGGTSGFDELWERFNTAYAGDWRNRYYTGRMHDEVMRRNATQGYRLSVYHPREVVNTKVGRFSAPGYNRWPGGEAGWGLMRQARYGKYQPEPILTEPQWSVGQRDGHYERAVKGFWRTGGYRQAGTTPKVQLVDFKGLGYWGQAPATASAALAQWRPLYQAGLIAPQHANGLHFITPTYYEKVASESGLSYDEWISKYYVPKNQDRGNYPINSPNKNIHYSLESLYNQSLYNLDGPLGLKDIHRMDSMRQGKTVQKWVGDFEHNEQFWRGYKVWC
eukprot:GHVH01003951.1.p1 GENE.GHVH01003951.1~~GHVH01003951.1.p1  ORF type:complete len:1217 (-),score=170.08 GHVH01003951.1:1901-5551(-)